MANGPYKRRGDDYAPISGELTLPAHYYRSEEIYRQEVEKIFTRRWLMACREEEIVEPGDYVTVGVGSESLIVVRNADRGIGAFFNVCRHRGTRICVSESGRFDGGRIRCPYHAWTYALDGTLQSAPLMKDVSGFQKQDYPLFPAHVELWGGFVFINLAEQPVPFEAELGALTGKFEDWRLPELRIARTISYTVECNWKLILANFQECYHCPGVHPLLSKRTPFRSARHDCFDGAVIGGYMQLREPGGSMTLDGKAAAPPLGDVSGDDLQRVYYYSIYPNLLFAPHPDFVIYQRIRSISVTRVQIDCSFLLQPKVIEDPTRMQRFESAVEFWNVTNKEDWQVCEQMQQGLMSRRSERGPYSGQEDLLVALDKELLKALGHDVPVLE
jgi:Rieske 2Fe-2S family protein